MDRQGGLLVNGNNQQNVRFQCFCHRYYRSYAGIHMHLRFKHSDVFTRYDFQNNFIDNFLDQTEATQPIQLYKLRNISGTKENAKLASLISKQRHLQNQRNLKKTESQKVQRIKRTLIVEHEKDQQVSVDKKTKKLNEQQQPFLNHPFYSQYTYPFEFQQNVYPQPQVTYPIVKKKTLAEMFQQFIESRSRLCDKSQVEEFKNILKGLQEYIDANSKRLEDSRTLTNYISYCNRFSGEKAGPLIVEYMSSLRKQNNQKKINEVKRVIVETCINYIQSWLESQGCLTGKLKIQEKID